MTTPTEIRALIERAAKAVDLTISVKTTDGEIMCYRKGKSGVKVFNPLHSAEDCETLMVVLGIDVIWEMLSRDTVIAADSDGRLFSEPLPPNATPEQKKLAMRMAVLRAAAS